MRRAVVSRETLSKAVYSDGTLGPPGLVGKSLDGFRLTLTCGHIIETRARLDPDEVECAECDDNNRG